MEIIAEQNITNFEITATQIVNEFVVEAVQEVVNYTIEVSTNEASGKQNKLTAGANITIDETDPLKPVISSAGGGGGGSGTIDAAPTNGSGNAVASNGVFNELALKVDKVVGKSLILDSEVTRLSTMTAIFTTALKSSYDSAVSWISTNGSNLLSHLNNSENPHNVTKSQIGLSDVPNLSFSGSNTGDQDLSGKQNKLIAGTNITIDNADPLVPIISATGGGEAVDTSVFVKKTETILYHQKPVEEGISLTNVGNNCTVTSALGSFRLTGSLVVKDNGETAIIQSKIDDYNFTTVLPFKTNSNSAYKIKREAFVIAENGSLDFRKYDGGSRIFVDENGAITFDFDKFKLENNNFTVKGIFRYIDPSNNSDIGFRVENGKPIISSGYGYSGSAGGENSPIDISLMRESPGLYQINKGTLNDLGDLRIRNIISTLNIYSNETAADADINLPNGAFYKLTGNRVVYQKP